MLLDGQALPTAFKSEAKLKVTLPANLPLGDHTITARRGQTVLEGKGTYTAKHPLSVQASPPSGLQVGGTAPVHIVVVNAEQIRFFLIKSLFRN